MSHTSQVSAIFPPTTLWIEIASTRIALPVGGMPFTSPTWVPVPAGGESEMPRRHQSMAPGRRP